MLIAGMLLQKTVKAGLLLYDIARIICREDLDAPSRLEILCTQASQQANGSKDKDKDRDKDKDKELHASPVAKQLRTNSREQHGGRISIDVDMIAADSATAPSSATSPPGFWASQAPWSKKDSPRRRSVDPSWDSIFGEALHRAATGFIDLAPESRYLGPRFTTNGLVHSVNDKAFFTALEELLDKEIALSTTRDPQQ